MNIKSKNNTERELNQKNRIESLLKQYDFPIFTEEIIIEEMVRPHSHPILTLNTRPQTDIGISDQFIHEQFHWFLTDVVNRDDYNNCIAHLKTQYEKPEGDVGSTENGFWLHLIVNYNTRIVLQSLFGNELVADLFSGMFAYKQIEEIIEANWEKLTEELSDYNMIYKK